MNRTATDLIAELLKDPVRFQNEGQANVLLQCFFHGEPVERPSCLLRSNDQSIQHSAIFIASEIGERSRPIIYDIIHLLSSRDRYIRYHAMESVAVCAVADLAGLYSYIVEMLDNEDDILRNLAMDLMSRADPLQLEAARRHFQAGHHQSEVHVHGLSMLEAALQADFAEIEVMIKGEIPLARKYGAIAAKRLLLGAPALMRAVEVSDDPDLRDFWKEV